MGRYRGVILTPLNQKAVFGSKKRASDHRVTPPKKSLPLYREVAVIGVSTACNAPM